MNPQPRKAGPYVSEYLKLKEQIEQMQAQLEAVRIKELEAEIADMKKRIIAFGIRPEQLFSRDDLSTGPGPRSRYPAKYKHGERSWSGRGDRPKWFRDALARGVTADQMLIKSQ